MGNQQKKNQNLLDTQRENSDAAYRTYMQGANEDLKNSRANSALFRQEIHDKYSNSNNFMPQGMSPNASGWFDPSSMPGSKGGSGGQDFSNARKGYNELAKTGGVNRKDFAPALDSYNSFMKTGNVDADALRRRGTAQIPAFYDNYKNSLARRQNVQGGYSPGFDAQQAEIGREAGRAGFEASRQVEGDIADKVQRGKMFGTSGYGELQGRITGMEQGGKIAGLGGLTNIGQTNAMLGEGRANRNLQMQQFLQEQYQRGGIESARGLQNLYSSRSGEMDQSLEAWLRGRGQMDQNAIANLGIRGNQKGTDWMKWLQFGGSAGDSLTSAFGNRNPSGYNPYYGDMSQEEYDANTRSHQ